MSASHHIVATPDGQVSITIDRQPITPAETRRLIRDLTTAADLAEHTVRRQRDAGVR